MNPLNWFRRQQTKTIASADSIAQATVGPWDTQAQGLWQVPHPRDLSSRYTKWPKVAASRNASAVAGVPLRVVRRKRAGVKSAWASRPINNSEQRGIRERFKAGALDFELEELSDELHPYVALLRNPNPRMSGYELVEATELDLAMYGRAYWAIVKGVGVPWPAELWLLPALWVRPIAVRDAQMVRGYIYGKDTSIERTYEAEDVIEFKRPNPKGDPFMGYPDVEGCLSEADLSKAYTNVSIAKLDNGMRPGGIVNIANATGPQLEAARVQFESAHRGVGNVGRWMFLNSKDGIEVKDFPMGDGEAKFWAESDRHVRDVVAACFDMPVGLLNMEEKSLANGKVVAPHWQKMAIQPRVMRMVERINNRLTPVMRAALNDETLYVVADGVVDEDEDAKVTRVSALYTNGVLTLNESRAELGYEPVPEGDDFKQPVVPEQPDEFGRSTGTETEKSARPLFSKEFDPSQPRDDQGQWTDTGAGDGGIGAVSDVIGTREETQVARETHEQMATVQKRSLNIRHEIAIEHYVSDGHTKINAKLRRGASVDDTTERAIVEMDDALSHNSAIVPREIKVYRGSSRGAFSKAKAGVVYKDNGYVSTSFRHEGARGFVKKNGTIAVISVPKGSRALVGARSEDELILPRGSRFRVRSVAEPTDSRPYKYIHMELEL